MRDSFIFYRSFYEALKNLPRDVQGEIYTAIMEYSLNGNEIEQLKPIARSIFMLIKPQIDANNKRFKNGKLGGRPKQTVTKEKPNDNQTVTKVEPNVNDNDNVNNNIKENTPKGVPKKVALSSPALPVKNDAIDYEGLQETFNTMFADKLPMVQSLSPKRRAAVRARASEHGKSAIMDVFKKVRESKFLLGHNDRNWHTDFDWIFKPTNFIKILEGNFDDNSNDEIQRAGNYTTGKSAADKKTSRDALERLADAVLEQHQP